MNYTERTGNCGRPLTINAKRHREEMGVDDHPFVQVKAVGTVARNVRDEPDLGAAFGLCILHDPVEEPAAVTF